MTETDPTLADIDHTLAVTQTLADRFDRDTLTENGREAFDRCYTAVIVARGWLDNACIAEGV